MKVVKLFYFLDRYYCLGPPNGLASRSIPLGAAAGLAGLLPIIASLLANRAGFRAAKPLPDRFF